MQKFMDAETYTRCESEPESLRNRCRIYVYLERSVFWNVRLLQACAQNGWSGDSVQNIRGESKECSSAFSASFLLLESFRKRCCGFRRCVAKDGVSGLEGCEGRLNRYPASLGVDPCAVYTPTSRLPAPPAIVRMRGCGEASFRSLKCFRFTLL